MKTMQAKFRARMVAVLTVAAVALGFLQLAPAGADTTIVTFSILPGALSINNVETTVDIGDSSNTLLGSTVSGALGTISVSDTRNLSLGWIASGASTDFTSGANTILKAAVTVTQASTMLSNTNVTSFLGATASGAGGPIATAVAVGSNTATFAPTMSVVVPVGTPTGDYTGTFTSTVL